MFVIGLIDNVLRPILVGKDTQLPDYVVLISTVGGIALIGINGFVVGPLIAAMFVAVWQLLTADRAAAERRYRLGARMHTAFLVGSFLLRADASSGIRQRASALAGDPDAE